MGDFWVFGYGSLIWNPGFDYIERVPATLHGLHRCLCVHSWVHRGTQEKPGLVFGLDSGGSCKGVAMKVKAENRDEVIDYLRARELVTHVYFETWRNIHLNDGRKVMALVYRVDRSHPQYATGLKLDDQVEIVRHARGGSGPNTEYVLSTFEAMREAGISDHVLEALTQRLSKL